MKNQLIFGAIVVLVSVILSSFFIRPVQRVIDKTVTNQLGAQSVSVLEGDCLYINGLRSCSTAKPFTVATTTVCAIQTPPATSTLRGGFVRFTVSSTTATTVRIAKSATAFATTTNLGGISLGAGAQGTIMLASSTPNNTTALLDGLYVFGPSQYLVVGMQGGVGGGTFSPTGLCAATFEY